MIIILIVALACLISWAGFKHSAKSRAQAWCAKYNHSWNAINHKKYAFECTYCGGKILK